MKASETIKSGRSHARGERYAAPNVSMELYIAGTMPQSIEAVKDLRLLCERFIKDRYSLKVYDLARNPGLAAARQIVAIPTLIRVSPPPLRRVIGDLSDPGRVLSALGIARSSAEL